MSRPGPAAWSIAVRAGVLAGSLDLAAALTQAALRGRAPVRVLQSIASGWLGRTAYEGGATSAMLGLVSHFGIATAAAFVFVLAARRWSWLRASVWLPGAAYGVLVYVFMYEVVMPLSAIHRRVPRSVSDLLIGLAIHVVAVGWPIAAVARVRSAVRHPAG